jgi:Zn finger protein HypA/HybF involved in hydrogenase expression
VHERALVCDLADAMERAAGGAIGEVRRVGVKVGPLAGVTQATVVVALRDEARRRWGVDIAVDIVASAALDASAGDVRLTTLTLGS